MAVNFPFYIARRYLVSKKSHNIINIISGVSVAGVMIGTMALIIVLSVFNGFDKLVVSLFNSFNPDILVQPAEGKTFPVSELNEEKLKRIEGVRYVTGVIEENALLRYRERQYIATIKGVGDDYQRISGLDTMIMEGEFKLQEGDADFAVLGYGVAYYISADLNDYGNPISIYVPGRSGNFSTGLESGFNNEVIFPSGFFSIQQDYDIKYVIVPLRFVKKLLQIENRYSSMEIWLDGSRDVASVVKDIKKTAGRNFTVKDRFQQQELFYKIMKSEKWAIFLILSFILFIATFNVVGSLSMLILDKRQDIAMLQSLGAGLPEIRKIFMFEGVMISFIGAIAGLIFGAVICWLQMKFGFVKLGNAESTFVIDAYPVKMVVTDFIFVFLTVMFIGFLAAWYPVHNIKKINTRMLYQRF